jgi:hypothetical protein
VCFVGAFSFFFCTLNFEYIFLRIFLLAFYIFFPPSTTTRRSHIITSTKLKAHSMTDEKHWEDVTGDGGVLKSMIRAAVSLASDGISLFPEEGEEVHINYTGYKWIHLCYAVECFFFTAVLTILNTHR